MRRRNTDNRETVVLRYSKKICNGKKCGSETLSLWKPWTINRKSCERDWKCEHPRTSPHRSLLIETSNLVQAKTFAEIKKIKGMNEGFNMHEN